MLIFPAKVRPGGTVPESYKNEREKKKLKVKIKKKERRTRKGEKKREKRKKIKFSISCSVCGDYNGYYSLKAFNDGRDGKCVVESS